MTDAPAPAELTANLIEKADAGAQLFYAVYSLPKDKIRELFRDASPGFFRAYMRAQRAYQGGGS